MEATRDPIKDDLAHFLDGLTGEGQVMDTLVKWLKGNVKAGGRIINIHQELFGGLGLRREGVAEYAMEEELSWRLSRNVESLLTTRRRREASGAM
jgi:hypothetical protein